MNRPVENKRELIERILAHREQFISYGVKRLGIFGSFVRDQATESSDVDFYIEFIPEYKTLRNFISFSNFLKDLLGRKAEIITPQSLNKYIGRHIIQQVEYVPLAA